MTRVFLFRIIVSTVCAPICRGKSPVMRSDHPSAPVENASGIAKFLFRPTVTMSLALDPIRPRFQVEKFAIHWNVPSKCSRGLSSTASLLMRSTIRLGFPEQGMP